jgi:farnesyl-diphosphate farnesyltransferase
MQRTSDELLGGLLRSVSRSFYLTLRVLPGTVRRQIGLAYLLARASDTIADTDAVPKIARLEVLSAFRDIVTAKGRRPLQLGVLAGHQSSTGEQLLLRQLEATLDLLESFDRFDQERIREVLSTIISGQMLDVERFAAAEADHIAALETDDQLDDYTYRVAGCVGEFWTKMTRARVFPGARLDDTQLLAEGIRFGKGLQLVNILRDVPADLRIGRCYMPSQRLQTAGLTPIDLLDPSKESAFRQVYDGYLDRAAGHLDAGWNYTNSLPFRCTRVRLACAWPILIGVQTLAKLRTAEVLDPKRRVKISRSEVRSVMIRSVAWYPWPSRWRRLAQNTLPLQGSLAK